MFEAQVERRAAPGGSRPCGRIGRPLDLRRTQRAGKSDGAAACWNRAAGRENSESRWRSTASLDMVAAIWACLKAGAAFLPIDPANPPERTAFMLRDSAAVLVLVDGDPVARSRPRRSAGSPIVRLGTRAAAAPAVNPALDDRRGSDLAYVIYTSGSTGQPKGVLIEHGGLAQHIAGLPSASASSRRPHPAVRCVYLRPGPRAGARRRSPSAAPSFCAATTIWPPADFPAVVLALWRQCDESSAGLLEPGAPGMGHGRPRGATKSTFPRGRSGR